MDLFAKSRCTRIRILTLDQSTKVTGWSLFDGNELVEYGAIDMSSDDDPSRRFENMCRAVRDVIKEKSPDLVVFEEVAMQVNAYSLITLARLQGYIIAVCIESQIEFYIYTPSSWRKALGFRQGKGHPRKDLKRQAIAYCKEHYGKTFKEDIADAICIGAAFCISYLKEN